MLEAPKQFFLIHYYFFCNAVLCIWRQHFKICEPISAQPLSIRVWKEVKQLLLAELSSLMQTWRFIWSPLGNIVIYLLKLLFPQIIFKLFLKVILSRSLVKSTNRTSRVFEKTELLPLCFIAVCSLKSV